MAAQRPGKPFEPQATMARLVVLRGPGEGTIYPIYGEQVVIGRIGSCDLQFEDGTVSRLHARVQLRAGDFFIEDLDSHAGTLVNDQKVTSSRLLRGGDRIALGQVQLRFER